MGRIRDLRTLLQMKFKGELVLSQALEELNQGYATREVSYVS